MSVFCIFISVHFTDIIVTACIISREQWRGGDTVTGATRLSVNRELWNSDRQIKPTQGQSNRAHFDCIVTSIKV